MLLPTLMTPLKVVYIWSKILEHELSQAEKKMIVVKVLDKNFKKFALKSRNFIIAPSNLFLSIL